MFTVDLFRPVRSVKIELTCLTWVPSKFGNIVVRFCNLQGNVNSAKEFS